MYYWRDLTSGCQRGAPSICHRLLRLRNAPRFDLPAFTRHVGETREGHLVGKTNQERSAFRKSL